MENLVVSVGATGVDGASDAGGLPPLGSTTEASSEGESRKRWRVLRLWAEAARLVER